MDMITGETVIVERPVEVGRDDGNSPLIEWVAETVGDVLVAPGPRADVTDSHRPAGVQIKWTLHFPKRYPATLRGARVRVRGSGPLPVVGDPQHYTETNTPGRWSMPVEVGEVLG